MTDLLYIEVSRDKISRVIEFLRQYAEYLKDSNYPPYGYRADNVDGLIAELQKIF